MKNLDIGLLVEFYGDLLSDKAAKIMRMYYDLDMSLKEIADDLEITRQGVRDYLKRGTEAITDYESKLRMAEKFFAVRELVGECKACINSGAEVSEIEDKLNQILASID